MNKDDISELTRDEREILFESFERAAATRRIRGVLLSTGAVLVGIFLLLQLGLSAHWFAVMALTLLGISAGEKISYQRRMRVYEALIVKLVHRVERLEGVPLTPDDASPERTLHESEGKNVA